MTRAPGRRRSLAAGAVALAAGLVGVGPLPAPAQAAAGAAACDPAVPSTLGACALRDLADRAGIRIGAAADPGTLAQPDVSAVVAGQFSSLTAENAMKWYATEGSQGVETYDGADEVLAFAEAHGMEVRGHNLIWAQDTYTPAWVKAISDPDELRAQVHHHIASEMGRYAGRIHRWDVVNEPLSYAGNRPSDSVFSRVIGPGWLADTYRYAHQVDPDAELWLNEFGTDASSARHAALLSLVRDLLRQGVPIDGIGLQTHRFGVDGPDRATFERQLRDWAGLGLKVAITELDVPVRPGDPKGFARQADAYRTIFAACLAVAACEEVTLWGVTDRDTWLDGQGLLPAPTRPLLYDDRLRPKPARQAVAEVLAAGRSAATTTTTTTAAARPSTTTTAVPAPVGSATPARPVVGSAGFTG